MCVHEHTITYVVQGDNGSIGADLHEIVSKYQSDQRMFLQSFSISILDD